MDENINFRDINFNELNINDVRYIYNKCKSIIDDYDKQMDNDIENQRAHYLKLRGESAEGNDLCADNYCRLRYTGCDNE